ncbi:hypothetical protein ACIBEJ_17355 [Nonomuraea sp. NPDC050790]|uniref:hypothetical protein n=1 Tax=Nonomuraea sp. NPDC050790 TaxID=3364371 RepID=UPI0037AD414A
MRKFLVAAAIAGSVAGGLALAPAAQASTDTSSSAGFWGSYFSSNGKAYAKGKTFKSGGYVHTAWAGKEKFGGDKKYGYVWFEYYKGGSWHKFYRHWNGSGGGTWKAKGIKKMYTYTCWGKQPNHYCGGKHRIY